MENRVSANDLNIRPGYEHLQYMIYNSMLYVIGRPVFIFPLIYTFCDRRGGFRKFLELK